MPSLGVQLIPDIYVPTFDMKVDGVPLDPQIARQVMEISVSQTLDPPMAFQFRLNDPMFTLIDPDDGIFTEGTMIEISMGSVGNTKKLVTGRITAVSMDIPDNGPATAHVEGFDLAHGLTRGTVYKIWGGPDPTDGMADSDIVTQLVGEADVGLAADVDPTKRHDKPVVQNNISNLQFLVDLAHQNNFYLWIDEKTLHFKQKMPSTGTLTLERGKTLVSFSGRLSTAGQVGSVEVRGLDAQKQPISAIVKRSDLSSLSRVGQAQLAGSTALIADAPISNSDQAQSYAQAIIAGQQRTLYTGNGTSVGDPDMQVGAVVTLVGVGRFEGTYSVQEVTHTLGASGYQTTFQVQQKT
jgi:phage protein D